MDARDAWKLLSCQGVLDDIVDQVRRKSFEVVLMHQQGQLSVVGLDDNVIEAAFQLVTDSVVVECITLTAATKDVLVEPEYAVFIADLKTQARNRLLIDQT